MARSNTETKLHPSRAGSSNRRVNSDRRATSGSRLQRHTVEDGSAVRRLAPQEEEAAFVNKPKVSRRTRQNRARQGRVGARYIVFLTLICSVSVFLCIHYLQLRSDYVRQTEQIAGMASKLNRLKADNDAFEKATKAAVSMDDIRKTALDKLGLHYAEEAQIRYYNTDDESYVRQYQNVDKK